MLRTAMIPSFISTEQAEKVTTIASSNYWYETDVKQIIKIFKALNNILNYFNSFSIIMH